MGLRERDGVFGSCPDFGSRSWRGTRLRFLDLSLHPLFKVAARENVDTLESDCFEIVGDALALASRNYRDVGFLRRLPQQQVTARSSAGARL